MLGNSSYKLQHFCIVPMKVLGGTNATKTQLLRAAFCCVHKWEKLSPNHGKDISQIASSAIPKTSCSPSPAPDFMASNGWLKTTGPQGEATFMAPFQSQITANCTKTRITRVILSHSKHKDGEQLCTSIFAIYQFQ